MKNDLWGAVHDVFRKVDELFGHDRSLSRPEAPSWASEEPEIEEAAPPAAPFPLPLDELLHARSDLRRELDVVREKLAGRLNERDTYLVLFALVAHFDELVQTRFLKGDKLSWPTLQRELFQVDDAGEVFYDTIEDILMKPQTLPFVLEVYYFCLNDGFMGKYDRNPAKIHDCMQRLKQRIPIEEPKFVHSDVTESMVVEKPRSPAIYYIATAVALFAFYWVLMLAAWIWNPLTE